MRAWGIRAAVLTVGLVAAPSQSVPPRYQSAQLACSAFSEAIRTSIRGASGPATVEDKAGRDGILVIRGRDSSGVVLTEGWYDSLAVWRGGGESRDAPDTEGILGGRYRGVLSADGRYRSTREPFIPDEVVEVAELTTALDEFLPRLPTTALAVGGRWADSGLVVRRLSDRRQGSVVAERYHWNATGRRGDRYPAGDSLAVTLDQAIEEEGEMLWSPRHGPLTWWRQIKVAARIPATGGVKQAMRSIIDQRVEVVRRFDLTSACR